MKCSTGAYLQVVMNGKKIWALLDTGGELTVIPASIVLPEQIRPTSQQLMAANGSPMRVKGKATVNAIVEGISTIITGLVVDTTNFILGMDWIERNIREMNYLEQTVNFNQRVIRYHRPQRVAFNPLRVSEDVDFPPWSEVNRPTDAVHAALAKHGDLRQPCLIAHVMSTRTPDHVPLQIACITKEPLDLIKGTMLCTLGEVAEAPPEKESKSDDVDSCELICDRVHEQVAAIDDWQRPHDASSQGLLEDRNLPCDTKVRKSNGLLKKKKKMTAVRTNLSFFFSCVQDEMQEVNDEPSDLPADLTAEVELPPAEEDQSVQTEIVGRPKRNAKEPVRFQDYLRLYGKERLNFIKIIQEEFTDENGKDSSCDEYELYFSILVDPERDNKKEDLDPQSEEDVGEESSVGADSQFDIFEF